MPLPAPPVRSRSELLAEAARLRESSTWDVDGGSASLFATSEAITGLPNELVEKLAEASDPGDGVEPPKVKGRGLFRRCRSWRYVFVEDHPQGHMPGECRTCWRPCWRRSEPGTTRCTRCAHDLAEHPNDDIRMAFAAERYLTEKDLIKLANDQNFLVQEVARWQIERRLRHPSAADDRGSELS